MYFALIVYSCYRAVHKDFTVVLNVGEQILNNVHLVVKNVHIQYMDKESEPEVFLLWPILGVCVQIISHIFLYSVKGRLRRRLVVVGLVSS